MIVEVHMLQNFAPSCLNRDDTNSPKDCEFGGHRRARISSQCIKRSIRWHPRFRSELAATFALRSTQHARQIAKLLADDHKKPLDKALQVSRYMFQRMGFKEKNERLTVMLLLGDDEIKQLADAAARNWDLLGPLADVSLLWERLASRLGGFLGDIGDDAEMLGRLIADNRAGRANASQLQRLLELPEPNWSPLIDTVKKMPENIRQELRGLFGSEPGTDGEEEDENVPKKAAALFKSKRNQLVADALTKVKLSDKEGDKKGDKKGTSNEKKELAKQLKVIFTPLKKLTTKAVDVAMFGRMLAEIKSGDMNVDAACQVAHAISTNRVSMDMDYFTAVEELKDLARTQGVEQDPGAGMIGTVEFNSSCFYRYANIDLCQLRKNLGRDEELACKTVTAFIRAAVEAIPTGKQNSMAAQNPPDFLMAVVRKSGLWSLANGFVRPIRPDERGDLIENSVHALDRYWGKLVGGFGKDGILATPYWTTFEERNGRKLESLGGPRRDSVADVISEVESHLRFDDCKEAKA